MKKALLAVLIAALPFCLFAQAAPFTLDVQVPGMKDSTKTFLIYTKDTTSFRDSAWVKNGHLHFEGSLTRPVLAVVRTLAEGKIADQKSLYLEKGANNIMGTDSLKTSRIQHSLLNRENDTLHAMTDGIIEQLVALRMKATTIPKAEWKGKEMDSLNTIFKEKVKALTDAKKQFIQQHPASILSLVSLRSIAGRPLKVAEMRPLFNSLVAAIRSTPEGKKFEQALDEAAKVAIGSDAPAFVSKDTSGKDLSLKQVLADSKYVLVDFWASWCSPCRAENPNVVKNYTIYHPKGLNIISVSLDSKKASWLQAIKKDGMPWIHVSSLKGWKEPVAGLYNVDGIPDNFLLDHNGKIVARGLRGSALSEKLEALLP